MSRVVTRSGNRCSTHCAKCGSHFASVAAFDAHRRGKFRPKPGERARYCVAPEDAAAPDGGDLFTVVTEHGVCNVYGNINTRKNVVVWALKLRYERQAPQWALNGDSQPTSEELRAAPPPATRPSRPRRRRGGRSVPTVPAPRPLQDDEEIIIRTRPRRKK